MKTELLEPPALSQGLNLRPVFVGITMEDGGQSAGANLTTFIATKEFALVAVIVSPSQAAQSKVSLPTAAMEFWNSDLLTRNCC